MELVQYSSKYFEKLAEKSSEKDILLFLIHRDMSIVINFPLKNLYNSSELRKV